MTKLKNPLLALDARGTLASSITLQNNFYRTFARSKPTPTDPKSLAQIYQRWDYQDALFEWSLLSDAQKAAYRPLASRKKWPPLAYFIFEYLHALPNLAGRWHLDEPSGNIAHDSSKNTNHGTIFGATPTTGIISGARHFDGIDDQVTLGNHPSLNLTTALTLQAFARTPDPTHHSAIFVRNWGDIPGIFLGFETNSTLIRAILYLRNTDGLTRYGYTNFGDVIENTWYHLAGWWDGTTVKLYVNGTEAPHTTLLSGTVSMPTKVWYLSRVNRFVGTIDHVSIHTKALNERLIKLHSQRRYP